MLGEHPRVRRGAQLVEQLGRALDVSEEERHGPGREVPPHGNMMRQEKRRCALAPTCLRVGCSSGLRFAEERGRRALDRLSSAEAKTRNLGLRIPPRCLYRQRAY